MSSWLRNDFIVIGLIVLFTLAVVLTPTVLSADTEPDPEPCPLVGKAGSASLYRCEDWEMGMVCYLNNFGFLFCLPE